MTSGIDSARLSVTAAAGTVPVSWMRVVLWTVLFQFAWNWQKLPNVVGQGAMPDNDDFLRLQQVRDWIAGQGWYDLVQHRMDPPVGADIHWSRLVDVPIAALIALFGAFTDTATAERLAMVVWPTLLLVAAVLVVVAVCRAIIDRFNPLLAVMFTVMCFTALTEFAPGRIDHHSIQILLFCLTLLGLVNPARWWGHLLAGAAIAASISIGLDAILLIMLVLAWLGLDWALMRDRDGKGLMRVGAGMAAASLILYPLNFAPAHWLVARCDANSMVYLVALWAVASAFAVLALLSPRLSAAPPARAIAARLGAGLMVGLATVGVLYLMFPHCAAGPYASVSAELNERWLVNVNEAKGLLAKTVDFPEFWLSGVAYSLVLLAVGAAVAWRYWRERPAVIALFATLVLSIVATLIQYRAMRVGVFASIPLSVIFATMSWQWLSARMRRPALAAAAQVVLVVAMMSPVWFVAGGLLFPDQRFAPVVQRAVEDKAAGRAVAEWKTKPFYLFCNEAGQYDFLASLPAGHVMSDLNSGPAILVFTGHTVVGGGYHRNERAILDMLDFFETDLDAPRRLAAERRLDYVAWCDPGELDAPKYAASLALAVQLAAGTEPDWLERLSPAGERLQVFRVHRERLAGHPAHAAHGGMIASSRSR